MTSRGNTKDYNVISLAKKCCKHIRRGGISELISVAKKYLGISHEEETVNTEEKKEYRDVLFVNGCNYSLPHPIRYRVTHQREQLEFRGISTDVIYFEDIDPTCYKYYGTIIIFRCPYTDAIGLLINNAQEHNKKVYFDIDDLVIDTKYTDKIPFVSHMNKAEKANYDNGVNLMKKTMLLCDGIITSTNKLAQELHDYSRNIFVNRNASSEEMVHISKKAMAGLYENHMIYDKDNEIKIRDIINNKRDDRIRIGYFSGSITHNDDFELVKHSLAKVLQDNDCTELLIVGLLDIPSEFEKLIDRITTIPFIDWRDMQCLMATVDINIAPLINNEFNEAKSENKWMEAALVKVPTMASNIGAFKDAINDGHTGVLVNDDEWYDKFQLLIHNASLRKEIGLNAYEYVLENYRTINAGSIEKYLMGNKNHTIAFIFETKSISGGILVALKHMEMLRDNGADVMILNRAQDESDLCFDNFDIPVLSLKSTVLNGKIDVGVATFWKTAYALMDNSAFNRKLYLVQMYETDFYEAGNPERMLAERTYYFGDSVKYITISQWCRKWMLSKYNISPAFGKNGIDTELFKRKKRDFKKKIRILIEGDSTVYYKNINEALGITDLLDSSKYEIWYVTYNRNTKLDYHVDRIFVAVPNDRMHEIYEQCHILLKTSILESFSYPPLEMMATGGYVVVAPNSGNEEYIKDEYNCLTYQLGDYQDAKNCIERIVNDSSLRNKLDKGAIETVEDRDWNHMRNEIIKMYA